MHHLWAAGVTGDLHLLCVPWRDHHHHHRAPSPPFRLTLPWPAVPPPWPVCSTSVDVGAASCAANDLASTAEVAVEPGKYYFIVVGRTRVEDDPFPLQLGASLLSL